MRVESGPAKTDRNWRIVQSLVFIVGTLWFLKDGLYGYRNVTREAANRALQAAPFDKLTPKLNYDDLPEEPTEKRWQQVAQQSPDNPARLYELLGVTKPTFSDGADQYFVGQYGYGKATVRDNRVSPLSQQGQISWRKWEGGHPKDEIQGQFYWAILPALIAIYFLWRTYQAATLHVTVDDEGVVYRGQRIAFADIVSLRDYNPKGWIDLYYKSGADEQRLRLDNQTVLLFDDIVAAICAKKGFKNEVQSYASEKARAEAEDAAAAAAEEQAADADAQVGVGDKSGGDTSKHES